MRILILALVLASQTFAIASAPSRLGPYGVFSGSFPVAEDTKSDTEDGKKKKRTWVPRKRTVVV
ncbi:hypothetical protein [Tropicibacter sp. S64]|uniref:hypothetical protein n=1 Tax=Tropicibacter sp. S64 TaxID=3415122 RepID=UPI003C7CB91D